LTQLVITAVGPDRPGLVRDISGHIHAAGANLADSRMVNLRGHFALLVLVEGGSEVLEKTRKTVQDAAPSMGLTVTFSEEPAAAPRTGVPYRLKTYSMDQPGLVHKITSFLQEHGINIEELESDLDSAPFMGTSIFTMEVLLSVPPTVSVKELRQSLENLGATLNCDIDLVSDTKK
jgi:glycine cleavage system transcriptional repressor